MAWKLEYEAPRGLGTNRGFWAVHAQGLWYYHGVKLWAEDKPEGYTQGYSNCDTNGPKTTRAFIRYLRRHPELKGYEVYFSHNGYLEHGDGTITRLGIIARWEEPTNEKKD